MRLSIGEFLLCVGLGVIITITLAVAIPIYTAEANLTHQEWKKDGSALWPRPVPADWIPKPYTAMTATSWGFRTVIAHASMPSNEDSKPDPLRCTLIVSESGWPMKALASECWHVPASMGGSRFLHASIPGWIWQRPSNVAYDSIGTVPLWTGVAFNSFFWAVATAIALKTRRALVALSRFARGRCLNCGYDLRGVTRCPECGLSRVASAASACASRAAPEHNS